tara:strand:+ start:73 stop:498 length:426 start_codon:yes stop_codon:yes gene_type:complete
MIKNDIDINIISIMNNELIKNLEKSKQELILNIYENNFDGSVDRTNICINSINCIDEECDLSHCIDLDNRKIVNDIIQQKDECVINNEDSFEKKFEQLSLEIKENLKEIKEIEEYLQQLNDKLNEKKERSRKIAKEMLKII